MLYRIDITMLILAAKGLPVWIALTVLAFVLLLWPMVFICHAGDLPQAAADNAYKYLHVREKTNNNDHPEIDRMLAYLGLPKHLSWCAAFSLINYKEASDELRIKQPFPKYGRVSMLRQACISNPLKFRYITSDEVRLGSVRLQPGDLPLWANGTINTSRDKNLGRFQDFNGHTGLVVQQLSPRSFRSIEGNTQPGPGGNQREGGGVYERIREINGGNFRILGFCRAL